VRGACQAVGIGGAQPRELRTSFVSLLLASGVPVEEIARLVGHLSSRTTEVSSRPGATLLYRRYVSPGLGLTVSSIGVMAGSPACC
jgi:integrase